jgi:tRNA (adenine37-N6)-methyltransferase
MSSEESPRTPVPVTLTPIGWVRSPYQRRFGTPRQATVGDAVDAVLAMDPSRIPEVACADLVGFERVWVVSWLDRGEGWSPTVRTPRDAQRRGLFATRSPDRPNPIGLSCLQLVRVEGCDLHVRGIDLLDGTPILDIKPYVPYADAFPDSKAGWVDEPHPAAASCPAGDADR